MDAALSHAGLEHAGQSLPQALHSVLSSRGVRASTVEWSALLGLGTALVAAPERPMREWNRLTRDGWLIEGAAAIGVQLREMHPPSAATRLETSHEFDAHFRDSYLPLVRGALAQDLPVLAWRGWPAPCELHWGVLSDVRDETAYGRVAGQPPIVALSGPAHQVYVIEQVAPLALDQTTLLRAAQQAASAFWNGLVQRSDGVLVGAHAAAAATELAVRGAVDANDWLEELALARLEMADWLARLGDDRPQRWVDSLRAAADALRELALSKGTAAQRAELARRAFDPAAHCGGELRL
jgi:hypothetical protein